MRRHMVTFLEEALAPGTEWRSGLQWILLSAGCWAEHSAGFPGVMLNIIM